MQQSASFRRVLYFLEAAEVLRSYAYHLECNYCNYYFRVAEHHY